ncbi:hypothetical protein L2E82_47298 [Cichorium intybus]|uniref:Uncharacterized protein n=1 Tax=Cichorium intybus TaxID=13427 RepID=A0ACB8YVE2_CICIN|nr:hypothetical protein L2E82_47298 [Cichorium intybus]
MPLELGTAIPQSCEAPPLVLPRVMILILNSDSISASISPTAQAPSLVAALAAKSASEDVNYMAIDVVSPYPVSYSTGLLSIAAIVDLDSVTMGKGDLSIKPSGGIKPPSSIPLSGSSPFGKPPLPGLTSSTTQPSLMPSILHTDHHYLR